MLNKYWSVLLILLGIFVFACSSVKSGDGDNTPTHTWTVIKNNTALPGDHIPIQLKKFNDCVLEAQSEQEICLEYLEGDMIQMSLLLSRKPLEITTSNNNTIYGMRGPDTYFKLTFGPQN